MMSTAANIALLVLAVEAVILVFALLIALVIGGIAVVESTALTRRALRKQRKRSQKLSETVENGVERHLLTPITKFERGHAWTRQFFRSLLSDDSDPPS